MTNLSLVQQPDAGTFDRQLHAMGGLIHSWGTLEAALEERISQLRQAAGDVRILGGRTRPTMARLLTELRAIVSMRDRHGKGALAEIADIECAIQRIDRFRLLVIEGFYRVEEDGLLCRDTKNAQVLIRLDELESRDRDLGSLRERVRTL